MNPLMFFGAVFASVWMFQLRANFVTVFGDSIFIPDLVCLLSAMAGYYMPRSQGTAFVVICAAFSDVASDLRFGFLSLRDALIVQCLWPMRDIMWGDSKFSLFVYLFSFISCQKLALTIFLFAPAKLKVVPGYLPKLLIVSALTAMFGVITQSCFEFFMGQQREKQRR